MAAENRFVNVLNGTQLTQTLILDAIQGFASLGWIYANIGIRRGRRSTIIEEMPEEVDGIVNINLFVVIDVGSISAF